MSVTKDSERVIEGHDFGFRFDVSIVGSVSKRAFHNFFGEDVDAPEYFFCSEVFLYEEKKLRDIFSK